MDCIIEIKGESDKTKRKYRMGQPTKDKEGPVRDFLTNNQYYYRHVYNHVKGCGLCDPDEIVRRYLDHSSFIISGGLYKLICRYYKNMGINPGLVYEAMARVENGTYNPYNPDPEHKEKLPFFRKNNPEAEILFLLKQQNAVFTSSLLDHDKMDLFNSGWLAIADLLPKSGRFNNLLRMQAIGTNLTIYHNAPKIYRHKSLYGNILYNINESVGYMKSLVDSVEDVDVDSIHEYVVNANRSKNIIFYFALNRSQYWVGNTQYGNHDYFYNKIDACYTSYLNKFGIDNHDRGKLTEYLGLSKKTPDEEIMDALKMRLISDT